MQILIDLAEHQMRNIQELNSMNIGRCNYKGIIMYALTAIKRGKVIKPTGKWEPEVEPDNRFAEPIDITDENVGYHLGWEKEELCHCPHCDCVIPLFNVMPHHYCYVCGGRFGERNLSIDKITDEENEDD